MSETKETVADIVQEMRGYAHGMPDSYHVTMSWHDFRVMLTRIEAAAERERKPNPCFYPDTDCQFRMMDGKCCNPCVRGGKPGNKEVENETANG